LRSGHLAPAELALSQLVADYLTYYRPLSDLEPATEALPLLARVIELKARPLLPRPLPDEAAAELEEVLTAVAPLTELEDAVAFLRYRRRRPRRHVRTIPKAP